MTPAGSNRQEPWPAQKKKKNQANPGAHRRASGPQGCASLLAYSVPSDVVGTSSGSGHDCVGAQHPAWLQRLPDAVDAHPVMLTRTSRRRAAISLLGDTLPALTQGAAAVKQKQVRSNLHLVNTTLLLPRDCSTGAGGGGNNRRRSGESCRSRRRTVNQAQSLECSSDLLYPLCRRREPKKLNKAGQ